MNEEFKFPDEKESSVEVEVNTEGKVEIEIVDEEKPKHSKLREEPKPLDDSEIKEYSDRVKNRIDHLYKGYQTEKRRAEDAERAKEEAFRIAQSVAEENQKLKGHLSEGQLALLEQAKKTVAQQVEDAKRAYKEAYESGDSDKLVQANEELTAAKIKLERVNNFKPARQEPQKEVKLEPPRPDPKAEAWQRNNRWYGVDDEMTGFVLAYHSKLIKQGVDASSDEYYEKIDSRMRQVFPDYFDAEESPDRGQRSVKSNVAPATRSMTPKKVKLTQKQVDYAKRYRIPLERYALEVAKLQRG
ncbi:MAG: hypothetical protein EB120_01255 [Proteobacteria bacterium]|nr:hypothetical protein [Pseudomonadota bacterium]